MGTKWVPLLKYTFKQKITLLVKSIMRVECLSLVICIFYNVLYVHVKINLSEFDQNLFGISFTPPLFPSIVFLLLHESLSYGYLPLNLSLLKASVPLSPFLSLFLSLFSLSLSLCTSLDLLNWDSVVNFYYENIAEK